jgi:hypothetical protein
VERVALAIDVRDAPVEHVYLAEIAEHDVVGFEIAMDHTAAMRELDGEAHVGERT